MTAKDDAFQVHIVYRRAINRKVVAGGIARKWLYLGKEVKWRRKVEELLGAGSRVRLKDRLHRITADLRQPFLDLVADIGGRQRDPLGWWSSALSWKSSAASDLFLLISYFRLAETLIQEARATRDSLLLIVEDPWLFQQMREIWHGSNEVLLIGNSYLAREKIRNVIVGSVKRVVWFFRVLRNYLSQRWAWGWKPLSAPQHVAVAIYSYPRLDYFQAKGSWRDSFLGDLDSFLTGLGYRVYRFSPPEVRGCEAEIAARYDYFRPLILYATISGVVRSLMALWRPRWPAKPTICGLSIHRLLERDWWIDVGKSSQSVYRMFYECLRAMLRNGDWRWCIYPYENQPWEKMIAIAARERGIQTAGIQHSTLSVNYLPYFLGSGEAPRMPLPDVIFTSGPYPQRILAEGGNPLERLKMCGSIRYNYLASKDQRHDRAALTAAPLPNILVALPLERYMAEHLLAAIAAAFPSGGREEGVCFYIKTHPGGPIPSHRWGFPATEAPADLHDALQSCGMVVFIGTTVGPEAVALGRMAVRYRPGTFLDVDTSEIFGESIPTCTDDDIREVLLQVVAQGDLAPPAESVRMARQQLFAPFNPDAAADVFRL